MKYNDIWRIIGFCALLLAGQNVLSGKERIAPGAQNTVSVMAGAPKVKYSKMIFGQFIEHFDNQVYGGLYDPESKFADEDGFRKDVIEALREIKTPIVRWPVAVSYRPIIVWTEWGKNVPRCTTRPGR